MQPSSSGESTYIGTAPVNADHTFELQHVPVGQFVLELHDAYGPEPRFWSGPYGGPVSHKLASQSLLVEGDVSGVSVHPPRLASATGSVTFRHLPDEWKKNFDISRQSMTLQPKNWRRPAGAKLSADGTFTVVALDEGDYRPEMNLPTPLYIRSVRVNGQAPRGGYFHLNQGERASLQIEVSDDSGQVHASVVDEPGFPQAEPSVGEVCSNETDPSYALYLVPEARLATKVKPGEAESETPPILQASGYGTPSITLRLVPPGRYWAVVLQNGSRFAHFRNSEETPVTEDWWRQIAAKGTAVVVGAGEKVEIAAPDETAFGARLAAHLGMALNEDPFGFIAIR